MRTARLRRGRNGDTGAGGDFNTIMFADYTPLSGFTLSINNNYTALNGSSSYAGSDYTALDGTQHILFTEV